FSSRRRHTRSKRDWSSDVCSSDLLGGVGHALGAAHQGGGDAGRAVLLHGGGLEDVVQAGGAVAAHADHVDEVGGADGVQQIIPGGVVIVHVDKVGQCQLHLGGDAGGGHGVGVLILGVLGLKGVDHLLGQVDVPLAGGLIGAVAEGHRVGVHPVAPAQ